MDQSRACPGVLHGVVECTDTEDLRGEPSATQVRESPAVQSNHSAVSVRGRRLQTDVSVVEGVGEIINTRGRIVGTTTYRKRKETME